MISSFTYFTYNPRDSVGGIALKRSHIHFIMEGQKYIQLYGGILARSPSEDAGAENKPTTVLKVRKSRISKRKSPSNDDEVVGTGKRGRPRVDPKDETAIEVCIRSRK